MATEPRHRCPTCGQAVTILHDAREGTSAYLPARDTLADEALALLRELWDDASETRTIGTYRILVEPEQAARINRVLDAQRQEPAAMGGQE